MNVCDMYITVLCAHVNSTACESFRSTLFVSVTQSTRLSVLPLMTSLLGQPARTGTETFTIVYALCKLRPSLLFHGTWKKIVYFLRL
jgi:hypothetical protein